VPNHHLGVLPELDRLSDSSSRDSSAKSDRSSLLFGQSIPLLRSLMGWGESSGLVRLKDFAELRLNYASRLFFGES
jgi:hypothetical protein